jgi:hypothetical protein
VIDLEQELNEEDQDDFVVTTGPQVITEIQDLDSTNPQQSEVLDLDEIPDLEELEGFGTITNEDLAAAPSNIVKTR